MRAILPTETTQYVYKHNLSKMSNRELFEEGRRLDNMKVTENNSYSINELISLLEAEEESRGIY